MSDNNGVFAFGEGTLMQLREQAWELEDLGTRVATSPGLTVAAEPGADAVVLPIADQPSIPDDPLARIEQRLEELTRMMHSMQRRLDSIDVTVARVLAR